jgi:hypothetical protein
MAIELFSTVPEFPSAVIVASVAIRVMVTLLRLKNLFYQK